MKSKIKHQTIQQPITVEEEEIQQEEVINENVKPKRKVSEQQLSNLGAGAGGRGARWARTFNLPYQF